MRMLQMASTQAKQSFGDLLRRAAIEPVAIERHKKVLAIIAAPELFSKSDSATAKLAERRLARANQALIERDRLIRHHQIAFNLLALPPRKREKLIAYARENVRQWRAKRTCSDDYISRWSDILAMAPKDMARAVTSDLDGWGPALRQNSPWNGVLPE